MTGFVIGIVGLHGFDPALIDSFSVHGFSAGDVHLIDSHGVVVVSRFVELEVVRRQKQLR